MSLRPNGHRTGPRPLAINLPQHPDKHRPEASIFLAVDHRELDCPGSRGAGFTSRLGVAPLHANAWDLLDLPDVEDTLDALARPTQHDALRA